MTGPNWMELPSSFSTAAKGTEGVKTPVRICVMRTIWSRMERPLVINGPLLPALRQASTQLGRAAQPERRRHGIHRDKGRQDDPCPQQGLLHMEREVGHTVTIGERGFADRAMCVRMQRTRKDMEISGRCTFLTMVKERSRQGREQHHRLKLRCGGQGGCGSAHAEQKYQEAGHSRSLLWTLGLFLPFHGPPEPSPFCPCFRIHRRSPFRLGPTGCSALTSGQRSLFLHGGDQPLQ